jgi:excisionase family DNA binding protein
MEAYATSEPLTLNAQLRSSSQAAPPPLYVEAPDAATAGDLIDELLGRLAELVVDRLMERANPSGGAQADDWMDARGAATYLGIHRDTLRNLAAERSVPVHQDGPGCKLYFNRDELDEWRRTSKAPRSRLRAVS